MSKVSVTSGNVFRMSGSNDEVKAFHTQNKSFAVTSGFCHYICSQPRDVFSEVHSLVPSGQDDGSSKCYGAECGETPNVSSAGEVCR